MNSNPKLVEFLKTVDSPTLSNAVETLHVQTRDRGFTPRQIRCLFPEFGHLQKALAILNAQAGALNAREIKGDRSVVKVSLVGVGMRSHAGIASKMFATLAEVGINIQIITTSEIKISVVIDEKYLELAVRSLHTAFGLDAPEEIAVVEEG